MSRNRMRSLLAGLLLLMSVSCVVGVAIGWYIKPDQSDDVQDPATLYSTTPRPEYLDADQVGDLFPEVVFETPPEGQKATVTRIIDGDTIEVRMNNQPYRVRNIGINTPERGEPCFAEATAANAALIAGKNVTLVKDVSETDIYGRLLRYVFVDNVFVDAALVAQGYAEAVAYAPDTTHAAFFERLEAEAEMAGLGCHPTGIFDRTYNFAPTSAAPLKPTPVPVTAGPTPTFECNCQKHCSAMASCEEAYFQLNECECKSRDGDGDGIPCESICLGH